MTAEENTHKSTLKRLWWPVAIFAIFIGSTFLGEGLLRQIGSEAISQSRKVLGYLIQIGIWLSAAHLLNRLAIVFIWDGLIARAFGGPIPRLITNIFTMIVYLIALTGIVGLVFKKSVTGFWATSGVVTLILGLALQNMLADVFTGLAINIERPFKIGDWVKVHNSKTDDGIVGRILEINWRTTRLETEIKNTVILPNRLLGTSMVTNFYAPNQESRQETAFCLDYSVPTERATRVLLAGARAAMGQKGLLEKPEPSVIVNKTNSLGVEYKVRYWFTPWIDMAPGMARDFVTQSILEHLKQAGIPLAYPKQDLYYTEMPTRYFDTKTLEDRTELLGRISMFEHLESDDLKQLAGNTKQRLFNKGEKLIKQGETGDSMFVLGEGLLHAFINTNGDTELKVGQIVPGQFFGEMSLLTGEPRTATIVAITDVVAHEITKDNMNALFKKRPEIAETISTVVAERKVMNSQAMIDATPEEKIEETKTMAQQIMSKMKSFFKGVF